LVEHDLAPRGNGSDLGKVFFEIIAEVAQLVEHDLAPRGNGSDLGKVFFEIIAEVAQLVEHDLAKVGVAGSSPVFRSVEEYTSFSCIIQGALGWWNGRHARLKILWPLRLCGFKSRSEYCKWL
jgi:hypothetical protein